MKKFKNLSITVQQSEILKKGQCPFCGDLIGVDQSFKDFKDAKVLECIHDVDYFIILRDIYSNQKLVSSNQKETIMLNEIRTYFGLNHGVEKIEAGSIIRTNNLVELSELAEVDIIFLIKELGGYWIKPALTNNKHLVLDFNDGIITIKNHTS